MSIELYYTNNEEPMLSTSQPQNPYTTCALEYLNEGGANFVFRILPANSSGRLPPQLQRKLLRLRKNLPHVQSADEQYTAFEQHFKPLFPLENLVEHELIKLESGVPSLINDSLVGVDRASHRNNDFLPSTETYGMLVTDMTPAPEDVFVQLKPKWLGQSPTAPTNAKRCRTCALRAQRASKKIRTATDAQEVCSLALVSDNENERRWAVTCITKDDRLQSYLINKAQPLLHELRSLQQSLDSKGVLHVDSPKAELDLCKAMTLRDCTLFLKRSGDKVDARLADLDLKQSEKLATWKCVEQTLLDEGWYTKDVKGDDVCLLARQTSQRT